MCGFAEIIYAVGWFSVTGTSTLTTFRELALALREADAQYRERVHELLFSRIFEARQVFAPARSSRHVDLTVAIAWALENPATTVDPLVAQLGQDHRRLGFPPEVYDTFAQCLIDALDLFDLSPKLIDATSARLRSICTIMKDAAVKADWDGIPPAHTATVAAVERPNRKTAVVLLESAFPIGFQPGQALPVTTAHLPGVWRLLTPANISDETAQVSFHITDAGDASTLLTLARPGDVWTLGNARGKFPEDLDVTYLGDAATSPDLFLCYGTGWAAVRSYLLGKITDGDSQPVAVIAHAESPGGHYDLLLQNNLVELAPEISMQHTVSQDHDPVLYGTHRAFPEHTAIPEMTVIDNPAHVALEALLSNPHVFRRCVLVGPVDEVTEGAGILNVGLARAGIVDCVIETHPWGEGQLTQSLKYGQSFPGLSD